MYSTGDVTIATVASSAGLKHLTGIRISSFYIKLEGYNNTTWKLEKEKGDRSHHQVGCDWQMK